MRKIGREGKILRGEKNLLLSLMRSQTCEEERRKEEDGVCERERLSPSSLIFFIF